MKFSFKLSSDTKVKILQALVYLTLPVGLYFFWDGYLLLAGLVAGWWLWLLGIHASLHMLSSHKAYIPKNNIIKHVILFFGTICALGSNISWAATHRKHHKYSDHEGDPHSPNTHGGGFWRSVKLWFYYFPTYLINPRTVKDLTTDVEHKFYHRHYYKINAAYVAALGFLDPAYIVYFYLIPVMYVHLGISYITVLAHNTWLSKHIGYINFDSNDLSYNNTVASLLFAGEGNHNNHHALPGAAHNAFKKRDIDLGYWFIKLIGRIPEKASYYEKFYS